MKTAKLIEDIRYILFYKWDPIGVNNNKKLENEYDDYIGKIITILINENTIDNVAQYLYQIEQNEIGVTGDYYKCKEIAKELQNLIDLEQKNSKIK
ncbi:MAG: hypothetical protein ACLVKO_08140 [Dysgonomonas sp.]